MPRFRAPYPPEVSWSSLILVDGYALSGTSRKTWMGVSEYSTSCGAESDCDCDILECFRRLHGGATPPP